MRLTFCEHCSTRTGHRDTFTTGRDLIGRTVVHHTLECCKCGTHQLPETADRREVQNDSGR